MLFVKCARRFLSFVFFFIKMEARFLMEKLEAELGKEVFLDSDDLKVGVVVASTG